MSGDEPYAGHNGAAVLLLILLGLLATGGATLYGIRLLVRACVRRTPSAVVGTLCCLAWTAAVGMYTWGVLHLLFLDEHAQADECRDAIGARRLTGYAPSFVPLHFGCRTSGGQTIEAVIPGYVNPSVLGLGICAIALTVLVIALHKEESQ